MKKNFFAIVTLLTAILVSTLVIGYLNVPHEVDDPDESLLTIDVLRDMNWDELFEKAEVFVENGKTGEVYSQEDIFILFYVRQYESVDQKFQDFLSRDSSLDEFKKLYPDEYQKLESTEGIDTERLSQKLQLVYNKRG